MIYKSLELELSGTSTPWPQVLLLPLQARCCSSGGSSTDKTKVSEGVGSSSSAGDFPGSAPPSTSTHSSASSSAGAPLKSQAGGAGAGTDLFSQAMQSKAEDQLRRMLEQQSRLSAGLDTQEGGDGEDEEVEDVDEEDRVGVWVPVMTHQVPGQSRL